MRLWRRIVEKQFLTFEELLRLNTLLASIAIEATLYDNWSSEFKLSNLLERITKLVARYQFDPYSLTTEQLGLLSFGKWDSESQLWLVPVGLYPFLAEGTLLTGIDHAAKVVGVDTIDPDARFGCIAYGITKSE